MERLTTTRAGSSPDQGWTKMFDGKTLAGWTALMNPDAWSVRDGTIVGSDTAANSLLFYRGDYELLGGPGHPTPPFRFANVEFKADIRLNHGGISSMYFRAEFRDPGPTDIGVAPGYIAQANNTAPENEQRTGSLYSFAPFAEQLVPDDTWWTQHVIATGDRIQIFVNDRRVVDYVDPNSTYTSGYLALLVLGQYAATKVEFRNLMLRDLGEGIAPPVEPDRR